MYHACWDKNRSCQTLHCGFILRTLCLKPALSFSPRVLPSLSLSISLSISLSLSLRCLSLAHCSLSLPSCLWCTYVVTFHWLFPLLCSYTQASGAFTRQRQPLLRVLVMCASSVWSSVPFLPFHSYKRLKGGVTLLPCSFPQEGLKRDNKN